MTEKADNLALWDSVAKTDPNYTKGFRKGGGFSGTSPNATYQVMRATRRWGPQGIGWGVEKMEEAMLKGHTLKCGDACLVHCIYIRLWYKENGCTGEVFAFGQTTFVGENKYGAFTDEEAPKKSCTDATMKALSKLGFSADIFLGFYDDNKYVAEVRQEFAEPPAPADPLPAAKKALLAAVIEKCKTDDTGARTLLSNTCEKLSGHKVIASLKELAEVKAALSLEE